MDAIAAYSNTELDCRLLKTLKADCEKVFADDVWIKSKEMAEIAGIELATPRVCQRQTKTNNVPSSSAEEYYKLAIFITTMDHLISEMELNLQAFSRVLLMTCTSYPSCYHP